MPMKLLFGLGMCCFLMSACATSSPTTHTNTPSQSDSKTKDYHPFEWANGEKPTLPPGIPES